MHIVDVEDGVMAPSGTNKKATAQLVANNLAKIVNDGAVITANTSTDAVRITQTGSGNALVVEDSTNPDSTPFVVTSAGNVGIGTATPQDKLDVNGAQIIRNDGTAGWSMFVPKFGTDPFGTDYDRFDLRVDPTQQVTFLGNSNGGTGSARDLGLTAGALERMRITSGGNVGIGTSTPAEKLDVAGNIKASSLYLNNPSGDSSIEVGGAGNVYIDLKKPNSDDSDLRIATDGTDGIIDANGGLCIFTAHTERMRITSAGNVGIGTTTPVDKLSVNGPIHIVPATTNSSAFVDEANRTNTYLSLQGSAGQTDFAYLRQIGTGDNDLTISLDLHDDANHPSGGQAFAIRNVPSSTNPDSTPITNFIVNTNGNVGIGTATPVSKLHLTSSDPSWNSGLTLENTAASRKFALSTRSDLSSPSRFSISDETIFQERVSLLGSNGNLGIGELNPSSKLHVAGDLTMSSATVSTSATAGTNGGVPAQVAGYLVVNINGTARKIPYYA
jgi:hypothetical protein